MMLTCPNCGHSNQDHYNFCEKCGANLNVEDQPKTEVMNPVEENNNPDAGETEKNNIHTSTTTPEEVNGKQKKKSPFALIGLGLLGLFLVYILIANVVLAFSPVARLNKGLRDFYRGNKFTTESTVGLDYRGSNEILSLLDNLSFESVAYSDIDKMNAESSIRILYNGEELTGFKAGADSELVWIDPLKLYEGEFYYEFNNKVTDVINDIKIYKNALKKVALDCDKKEYSKIIKKALGRDLENSFGKVTITLDADNMLELLSELVEYAREDETLMKSVRKNGVTFLNTIIKEGDKGKLETLYDADTFEDALELFEDEEYFEEKYDMFLSNIESELEDFVYELFTYTRKFEITFNYGLFNNLKDITCEFTANYGDYSGESLRMHCVSSVRKGAKLSSFNTKQAKDIEDLIDDPEQLMDIAKEMAENLTEAIKGNKELQNDLQKIEDALGMDIEDLPDELDRMFYYMW